MSKRKRRPLKETWMSRGMDTLPCKHSYSCFTCPLDDCHLSAQIVTWYNSLPMDIERWREEARAGV